MIEAFDVDLINAVQLIGCAGLHITHCGDPRVVHQNVHAIQPVEGGGDRLGLGNITRRSLAFAALGMDPFDGGLGRFQGGIENHNSMIGGEPERNGLANA